MGVVEHPAGRGGGGHVLVLGQLVVAVGLVALQHRGVGQRQAGGQVQLARHHLDRQLRGGVGQEGDQDLVEIGQLVAGGVDAPVVRVARPQLGVQAILGDDPRIHARHADVVGGHHRRARAGSVTLGGALAERLRPALEAGFLGERVGVVVVVDVELRQVVLGVEGQVAQQHQLRDRERILPGEGNVVLVAHRQLRQLALPGDARAGAREHPVVGADRVQPEHEIVGVERLAIRPLLAGAQVDGEGMLVVRHAPVRHHVGMYPGAVRGELAERLRRALDHHAGLVLDRDSVPAKAAAILADFVRRAEHRRVGGQAVDHGGQLAAGHARRQHRRLAEGGDRIAGFCHVGAGGRPVVVDVGRAADGLQRHHGACGAVAGTLVFAGGEQRRGGQSRGQRGGQNNGISLHGWFLLLRSNGPNLPPRRRRRNATICAVCAVCAVAHGLTASCFPP